MITIYASVKTMMRGFFQIKRRVFRRDFQLLELKITD